MAVVAVVIIAFMCTYIQFAEDMIYRHLEPALAFQLEINRLTNYDITAIPCQNHRMHLYLGSAKVRAISEIVCNEMDVFEYR